MKLLTYCLSTFFALNLGAQSVADICNLREVTCTANQGSGGYEIASSFEYNKGLYTAPNKSMPVWFAARYINEQTIDTAFSFNFSFDIIQGPGFLLRQSSYPSVKGPLIINNWTFSEAGLYHLEVTMSGAQVDTISITVAEEFDLCSLVPARECGDIAGNKVFSSRGAIVAVDAVNPITAGLIDSLSGKLDTAWVGTSAITQIGGPGNMNGTTTQTSNNGTVQYVDISFDQTGIYDLSLELTGNRGRFADTLQFEVVQEVSVLGVKATKIQSYPNPVENTLVVDAGNEVFTNMRVFDEFGRLVKQVSQLSGNATVDVADLSTGLYHIVAVNNEGNLFETEFIKIK